MTDREERLQELIQHLEQLRLAADRIELTIVRIQQEQEDQRAEDRTQPHERGRQLNPTVRDRDGEIIHQGDRVFFLTRGRYNSTSGTIYRVARSGYTVSARDDEGRTITRSPRNVRIIRPTE